jgi:hypothetical protein
MGEWSRAHFLWLCWSPKAGKSALFPKNGTFWPFWREGAEPRTSKLFHSSRVQQRGVHGPNRQKRIRRRPLFYREGKGGEEECKKPADGRRDGCVLEGMKQRRVWDEDGRTSGHLRGFGTLPFSLVSPSPPGIGRHLADLFLGAQESHRFVQL